MWPIFSISHLNDNVEARPIQTVLHVSQGLCGLIVIVSANFAIDYTCIQMIDNFRDA